MKFHKKLVNSCGLPPSKLMRSLAKDFYKIGGVEATPTELKKEEGKSEEVSEARHNDGEMGIGFTTETGTRVTSRYETQPLLCSIPLGLINWVPYIPSQPVLNTPPPPPDYLPYIPPPSPHHTPQPVIYTPQVSPQPIVYPAYCWHCNLWGNFYSNTVH